YIAGLARNNNGTKRTCLFLFGALALLALPIYLSGDASRAVLSDNPQISKAMMSTHYTWAIGAIAALVVTGLVAWIELLRTMRTEPKIDPFRLVLVLAIVALGVSAVADEFGWDINHRELQIAV